MDDVVISKGTNVLDADGSIICTAARDITWPELQRRNYVMADQFIMPNGEHPVPLSLAPRRVVNFVRRAYQQYKLARHGHA